MVRKNYMKNNQIFIDACFSKYTERTPLWIMRQAGRYLPEYRKIREKYTFHQMMHTPTIMSDVTLLPFNRFDFDAAIMFSDILVIPESLGMRFELKKGVGPVFENEIKDNNDIANLNFDPSILRNIYDGISLIRKNLKDTVSLIGFSGSPWTIACYMLEGKPSKDYGKLRALLYKSPKSYELLMNKITSSIISYIDLQVESGVNAIQIFDSNSIFISRKQYVKYSLPYINKIINHINKSGVPSIYFARGISNFVNQIKDINANVIGVDWSVSLNTIRKKLGENVVLQGNLDPSVLLCNNKTIEQNVKSTLDSYGIGNGHIFNLGHGITPNVNPESVEVLTSCVKSYSPKFKVK